MLSNQILKSQKLIIKYIANFIFLVSLILVSQNSIANPQIVAISQIIEHKSLDQARSAILEELKNAGYIDGENIKIIYKNAQGNIANNQNIANHIISLNPDLIIAISTNSAQSLSTLARKNKIPLVFSSVSNPVEAGIVSDLNTQEAYVTGAMDAAPRNVIKHIIEIATKNKAAKVGILFNSGEYNSSETVRIIRRELEEDNIEYKIATVQNTNQVVQAFKSLAAFANVIYLPSDNTIFAAMPSLVKLSSDYKIPLISNDVDSVRDGVFACAGYSQRDIGRLAGSKAVKILQDKSSLKSDFSHMELVTAPENIQYYFNEKVANLLGINIPPEINGFKTIIINN